MPTYEYGCRNCGHHFERFQRMTDEPVKECEECGSPVRRVIFPVGILFKGPGFHVNDYAKSTAAKTESNASTDANATDAKTDTKTESKAEGKTESKGDPKPAAAPA